MHIYVSSIQASRLILLVKAEDFLAFKAKNIFLNIFRFNR